MPVSALMIAGDILEALADQVGGPAHDLGPVPGGDVALQTFRPFAALARTAAMSAESPEGTAPICSSVAGEKTGMVFPEIAGRQTVVDQDSELLVHLVPRGWNLRGGVNRSLTDCDRRVGRPVPSEGPP